MINSNLIMMLKNDQVYCGDKEITENGIYNANSDGYTGYEKVTVNVPVPSQASDLEIIQEYIFVNIYGHTYDPENPVEGETPPQDISPMILFEDGYLPSNNDWAVNIGAEFVDFYQTYGNPDPIQGSAYSSDLSAFQTATGYSLSHTEANYPRWGSEINPNAATGKSTYSGDRKVAWCVYKITLYATHLGDSAVPEPQLTVSLYMANIFDPSTSESDPIWTQRANPVIVVQNGNFYVQIENSGRRPFALTK